MKPAEEEGQTDERLELPRPQIRQRSIRRLQRINYRRRLPYPDHLSR